MLSAGSLGQGDQLFPTRSSQLPQIKHRRKVFLKKLVGESDPTRASESDLTYKEFVILSLTIHFDISYVVHLLDLGFKYGTGYTAVVYILLQLSVGMPLLMLCLFLSSYSKKSFITFWDCVPLFEGLGYTVGILRLLVDAFNSSIGCLCGLLFTDVVRSGKRRKILNCEINGDYDLCFVPGDQKNYDCLKPSHLRFRNETIFTALQYHVRTNILNYNRFDINDTFNAQLFVLPLIAWVVITLIAALGLTRLKKFASNAIIVVVMLLCIISIYSVSFMRVNKDAQMLNETESRSETVLLRFDFWVDMIILAGEVNSIASFLWIGTLKGPAYSPQHAILIITSLKMIISMLFFCFASRVLHDMVYTYKLPSSSCMVLSGIDFILGMVPEVLLRARFGAVGALIWYLGMCYFCIIGPLFSVIGIVSTITQRFSFLARYRLLVCFTVGLVCITLTAPMSTNRNMELTRALRFFGPISRSVVLFIMILALMFMYSTNRIIDDYSFTYGVPPQKYWIVFWRTLPLIGLIAFIFSLYRIKVGDPYQFSKRTVIGSYVQMVLFLSPILVACFIKCCTHIKYKTLTSLARPNESWGPYNYVKRQARRYFYPQRDVKYRNTTLKCTHECIVNSRYYQEERRNQKAKIRRVVGNFGHYGEFTDLGSA